jgi:magnesium chelatase family protein
LLSTANFVGSVVGFLNVCKIRLRSLLLAAALSFEIKMVLYVVEESPMFVKVISMSVIGMESYPVFVEVDTSQGLPQFATVGLPDASVKESRDRIKAAIKNSGYRFPRSHVTINLAPADIKKEGTGFDLPIAVGILAAEELIKESALEDFFLLENCLLTAVLRA